MKKRYKILAVLLSLGIIGVTAIPNTQVLSEEERIYIPDEMVKEQLFNSFEKPTAAMTNLYNNHGLIKKADALSKGPQSITLSLIDESRSIEGVNYFKNTEDLTITGGAPDLRPVSELPNLKNLSVYSSVAMPNQSFDFLKNSVNLESLVINNRHSDGLITDFSGLNNSPNLNTISIVVGGSVMPKILLKEGQTTYTMQAPVILPKQFKDVKVDYFSSGHPLSYENGMLTWTDIPEDLTELCFSFIAESFSDDGAYLNYRVNMASIPIIRY